MMNNELNMLRCLELASSGLGTVSPNPLVGAVLIHDNRIIGEGWHQKFGGLHAEVHAINDCIKNGFESLLSESTLYINLEPCNHFGKTPPCTDLILEKKIPNVVIGMSDPFEEVNGKGIEKLRQGGVHVTENVLADECQRLNRRFITFHTLRRPYIILKFAQTKDGFIAPLQPDDKIHWISNVYSRVLVHKWRSEEDAIMVGANTVLKDNPRLTVRDWSGRNPVRITIDEKSTFPSNLNILNSEAKTIVFNLQKNTTESNVEYIKYDESQSMPEQICKALHQQSIQSVLIEGGLRLFQEFINENLWDEARIFTAPKNLLDGISAPFITGNIMSRDFIQQDELCVLTNKQNGF